MLNKYTAKNQGIRNCDNRDFSIRVSIVSESFVLLNLTDV